VLAGQKKQMLQKIHLSKIALMLMMACFIVLDAYAQQPDRSWGAIAIFCVPNGSGCNGITGGRGYGRTEAIARTAAISDCKGGDINLSQARYCKVVRTFNQGCVYVVAGCRKSSSVCGYAIGLTEREAESRCASQGFDCSSPLFTVGGCVGK
jgi:hypothetical protein